MYAILTWARSKTQKTAITVKKLLLEGHFKDKCLVKRRPVARNQIQG